MEIDYDIIDGHCSYCGRDACYHESESGVLLLSYCPFCDEYNASLEREYADDDDYDDADPSLYYGSETFVAIVEFDNQGQNG